MTGRFWTGAAFAAPILLSASLGGCGGTAAPSVSNGWVRLAANPGAPAAAYFTVTGGTAPATLTGVVLPMAKKAEMHETMTMTGGMTGMTPLASVDVPAQGKIAFAPGGRHVMLFGLDPSVKPGDRLTTTFTFADREPVAEPLKVVGPGDAAPY